jgi:hypothetical protein
MDFSTVILSDKTFEQGFVGKKFICFNWSCLSGVSNHLKYYIYLEVGWSTSRALDIEQNIFVDHSEANWNYSELLIR